MIWEGFMEIEKYLISMEIYMRIVFGNMGIRLALAEHIIKMETYEVKDIKNIIIMKENLNGIMKVENYIWKKTIKMEFAMVKELFILKMEKL